VLMYHLPPCLTIHPNAQGVRPAYMDELERLQAELNALYGAYLDKCAHAIGLQATSISAGISDC
jgi:hypothetical protein